MNRLFLAASVGVLCLAALTAHATAAGQNTAAPPAKSADQERYEAELRRFQAEQERYQKGVREAEAARQRYERDSARHQRELERRSREEAEDQQRQEQRQERRASEQAREAAERQQRQERRAAEEAEEAADRQQRQQRREARAAARDGRAPEAAAASAANAPAVPSAGSDCERRGQRNRRRGRTAGGILGGIARTFTPIGGVAGMVTGVLPVGELLGEAIAGLLDCDEQQKAATATEEAVRGGVGTTATWTSETRPGVTGASTVVAAERTADGGDCMTVTDVVIVDGEETRAPKRLCRVPPSSRYVRV